MTIATELLLALVLSTACLVLIGAMDPKRRKSRRGAGNLHSLARAFMAAVSLVAGLWLWASGAYAYFLIWIGYYLTVGWVVALCLPTADSERHRR
ncbi:MAG: hypothetical protein AAGC70_06220 [Pseudomonadota bacterium]